VLLGADIRPASTINPFFAACADAREMGEPYE